MKELREYVEQKNAWTAIFGDRPLDLVYPEDRQKIAESIDSDLSPENLCMDGEASASFVRKRMIQLRHAAEQLQQLDPSIKFYEL